MTFAQLFAIDSRRVIPEHTFALTRELSQILAFLEWPGIVEPTLQLMHDARRRWMAAGRPPPDPLKPGAQEESIWFARVLCEVPADHFSSTQRDRFFGWFAEARQFKGGNNVSRILDAIKTRALDRLEPDERARIEAGLAAREPAAPKSAELAAPPLEK